MISLSTQDIWYIVGTVCMVWITGFLCWALYEIAKLIHQTNAMVSETREKMGRFERAIVAIGDKLGNATQYLGFIAEGGKQLMSFLHTREERKERAPKRKQKETELSEMPEES